MAGRGLQVDEGRVGRERRPLAAVIAAVNSDRLVAVVLRAAVLSLALFLLLDPETYGLVPNSIDPNIYTGYALNLGEMLETAGLGRYYVSRWSMYLPSFIAVEVFGPVAGRLVLRWLLAMVVLVALWRLGRRFRWNRRQELFAGTLLLTVPVFARALFTDYFEYVVVGLGLVLVCLCLRIRQSAWSAASIGALLASMMVANPFALVSAGMPIVVALWFGSTTWRHRWITLGQMIAAFAATLLLGWLYFRVAHGFGNVYAPTVDFLVEGAPRDPFASDRNVWWGRFVWVYAPLLVVALLLGAARVRREPLERTERMLVAMVVVQWLAHLVDQLTRGDGFEIAYYWAPIYPVVGLLLAVVSARIVATMRGPAVVGLTVAWLALVGIGVPERLRLPAGLRFAALAVVAVVGLVAISRRAPALAWSALLGAVGWMHVGAPPYDPSAWGEFDMSPRYDTVYRSGPYASETLYREGIWFVETMRSAPHDTEAWFLSTDGFGYMFFFYYGVAVTDRVILRDETPLAAFDKVITDGEEGAPVVVAMLGSAASVETRLGEWAAELPPWSTVVDEVRGATDQRLVVLEWDADDLERR